MTAEQTPCTKCKSLTTHYTDICFSCRKSLGMRPKIKAANTKPNTHTQRKTK